jgi:uncharacterized Zn finger protein
MSWKAYGGFDLYPRHVSAAERRMKAQRAIAALRKKGHPVNPVTIEGRQIARSFWGRSWCENLERYSDFENRLPRGRTYVRSGAVLDLQVAKGRVDALVSGSDLYSVRVEVSPLGAPRWKVLRAECAGRIGTLVELLQGRLSDEVMRTVTDGRIGLFPSPPEIRMSCSCPDWAGLCKHLAATLYGVGARLDHAPELLFVLRGVDSADLIDEVASAPLASAPAQGRALDLDAAALSEVFGIDVEGEEPAAAVLPLQRKAPPKPHAKPRGNPPRKPASTITSKELSTMGVSPSTRQNWLIEGVLKPTGTRGLYFKTRLTKARIARYRERRLGG